MYKLLFLFFTFLFSSNGVFLNINNKSYSFHDFFSRYPKKQWERADSLQKDKMISDFINRELCVLEAHKKGFQNDPVTAVKIYNRSQQILINESYEHFVASPLVSTEELALARTNAKKELFVNHILIGHTSSNLSKPPKRTIDEALLLAQKIQDDFLSGIDFFNLAEKYSDDPGVKENLGKVGWVPWGATVANFQSIAFSLNIGTISDPVLTNYGYHLILVSDTRPSNNKYLDSAEYENLILNISKNSIREKLRPAAIKYDDNIIKEYGVVFNLDAVSEIYNFYIKNKTNLNSSTGVDASFFDNLSPSFVLLVYNNKGYGFNWFLKKLERASAYRKTIFKSEKDILSLLRTLVLQEIAKEKAMAAGIDGFFSYKRKVDEMVSGLLYDSFLQNLIDATIVPDSSLIKKYYEHFKLEKYKQNEQIIIKEIKVFNRELADSIYVLLKGGADFSTLAEKYSSINAQSGGLYGPFSREQARKHFDLAYNLKIGDYSSVFSSNNSSFSIIQLVEKISETFISFDSVYNKIESLLLKEEQEKSKTKEINALVEKNKIKIILDVLD